MRTSLAFRIARTSGPPRLTYLVPPTVERLLGDLEGPKDLLDALTFAEHSIGLAELSDDLLGVCLRRFTSLTRGGSPSGGQVTLS
jgi:hypothetical protein